MSVTYTDPAPTLMAWAKTRGLGTCVGGESEDLRLVLDDEDVVRPAADDDLCGVCGRGGMCTPAVVRVLFGDFVVEHERTGGRVPLCAECARHGIDDSPRGLRVTVLAAL